MSMKSNTAIKILSIITILGASCATNAIARDTPKHKKICFIAGKDSHAIGQHEHSAGLQYLSDTLSKNMPGIETVIHKGGWPTDPTFFENADAVVIYCDGGANHVALQNPELLSKLKKARVGIACLHYGVEVPRGEPGNYMLDWTGGYFETDWSVNPHWNAEFKSFPNHPVTNGMQPFELKDEWYFHMRFRENMQGITPILSAVPPLDTIKRPDGPHSNNPTVRKEVADGLQQHVAWVSVSPEGSRGFATTGGHFHKNWQNDNFRKLVLNAIAWIANIDVPDTGVPSLTPTDEELDAYIAK